MGPKLTAILGLNDSGYKKGLEVAKRAGQGFASDFKRNVGGAIATAFSLAAVKAGARAIIDYGSNLTDLSSQTGISTEMLQRMEIAAIQTGISLDFVSARITNLARRSADAASGQNKKFLEAFERLGVTVDDMRRKRPDELFLQIAKNVRDSEFNMQKLNDVTRAFGVQGSKLVRAFRKDFAGLVETQNDSVILTEEQLNKLTAAGDKLAVMNRNLKVTFAPLLELGVDRVRDLLFFLNSNFGGLAQYLGARSAGASMEDAARINLKHRNDVGFARLKEDQALAKPIDRAVANISAQASASNDASLLMQGNRLQQESIDVLRRLERSQEDTANALRDGGLL